MNTRDDEGYKAFLARHKRANRMYSALIKKGAQCDDNQIGAVESVMRDRFPTLDNLDAEEFAHEARMAYMTLLTMFGQPLPPHLLGGKLSLIPSVVSDGEGGEHAAMVARCSCGPATAASKFFAFQLENHKHLHLQCVQCGTSYCPAGGCQ